MSYEINIDENHRVTFRNEQSYLRCRLEYLTLHEKDIVSFSFFVEQIFSNHFPQDVENIEHIEQSDTASEYSFNTYWDMIIDPACGSDSSAVSVWNTSSTSYISQEIMHISEDLTADETISVGGAAYPNVTDFITGWTKDIFKDEDVEPEDPIDNRFDILDL